MKEININYGAYSSTYALTDLYPESRAKLQEALASGEDFTTDWTGCKKEIRFAKYTREGDNITVEVSAQMDDLWEGDDLIYNDLNPHAVLIIQCVLDAIKQPEDEEGLIHFADIDKSNLNWGNKKNEYPSYPGQKDEFILPKLQDGFLTHLSDREIRRDAIYWYHAETLKELLSIYDHINEFESSERSVRKLAFLSILKVVSSQRGHFSYVTDNCKPAELKYYNAIDAYIDMLDRIQRACIDFKRQYKVLNRTEDIEAIIRQSVIHQGDARNCAFITDESVDLIVTSPPYLCAQDYVLTMRLNDFFFPDEGFSNLPCIIE